MFKPAPRTTVVIPFEPGPEAERGPLVNDAYFGKVPPDRLVVSDGVLFFKGDGQHRSKIGLSPQRATARARQLRPGRRRAHDRPPTRGPRTRPTT